MVSYKLKRHEVDRLLAMVVVLGWELVFEEYLDDGAAVTLRRIIPKELLDVVNEVEKELEKANKE